MIISRVESHRICRGMKILRYILVVSCITSTAAYFTSRSDIHAELQENIVLKLSKESCIESPKELLSYDGLHLLSLQENGNVILYDITNEEKRMAWSTETSIEEVYEMCLELQDGHLILKTLLHSEIFWKSELSSFYASNEAPHVLFDAFHFDIYSAGRELNAPENYETAWIVLNQGGIKITQKKMSEENLVEITDSTMSYLMNNLAPSAAPTLEGSYTLAPTIDMGSSTYAPSSVGSCAPSPTITDGLSTSAPTLVGSPTLAPTIDMGLSTSAPTLVGSPTLAPTVDMGLTTSAPTMVVYTPVPTIVPTLAPTCIETESLMPTIAPTSKPTSTTYSPMSSKPTLMPTDAPTLYRFPTPMPTQEIVLTLPPTSPPTVDPNISYGPNSAIYQSEFVDQLSLDSSYISVFLRTVSNNIEKTELGNFLVEQQVGRTLRLIRRLQTGTNATVEYQVTGFYTDDYELMTSFLSTISDNGSLLQQYKFDATESDLSSTYITTSRIVTTLVLAEPNEMDTTSDDSESLDSIIIGVIVSAVVLIVLAAYFVYKKHRENSTSSSEPEEILPHSVLNLDKSVEMSPHPVFIQKHVASPSSVGQKSQNSLSTTESGRRFRLAWRNGVSEVPNPIMHSKSPLKVSLPRPSLNWRGSVSKKTISRLFSSDSQMNDDDDAEPAEATMTYNNPSILNIPKKSQSTPNVYTGKNSLQTSHNAAGEPKSRSISTGVFTNFHGRRSISSGNTRDDAIRIALSMVAEDKELINGNWYATASDSKLLSNSSNGLWDPMKGHVLSKSDPTDFHKGSVANEIMKEVAALQMPLETWEDQIPNGSRDKHPVLEKTASSGSSDRYESVKMSSRQVLWIQSIRSRCSELQDLFSIHLTFSSLCKEVVRFCNEMTGALNLLDQLFTATPRLKVKIDPGLIEQVELFLSELVETGRKHMDSGTVAEYVLSKKTCGLLENVSQTFRQALVPLQLGQCINRLHVNMHFEENIGLILSGMEYYYKHANNEEPELPQKQVKLGIFGAFIQRMEVGLYGGSSFTSIDQNHHRMIVGGMSRSRALALLQDSNVSSSSMMSSMESSFNIGDSTRSFATFGGVRGEGTVFGHLKGNIVEESLHNLQISPTELEKVDGSLLGRGVFSEVHKATWNGKTCVAKTFQLKGMKAEEIQTVYLRFAREAYTLSVLKCERILPLLACICTIESLTLVMPYMPHGSLKDAMESADLWKDFTPEMRHVILTDVAQGMMYLHEKNVFHRDLRSQNILLMGNHRAVLSDFGLSKMNSALSSITNSKIPFAGGTLAWALEMFRPRHGRRGKFTAPCDIYSYGVVVWEVLVAGCEPCRGKDNMQTLVKAVLQGEKPTLPVGADSDDNVKFGLKHAELMKKCLVGDSKATQRPSFVEISHQHESWT